MGGETASIEHQGEEAEVESASVLLGRGGDDRVHGVHMPSMASDRTLAKLIIAVASLRLQVCK